MGKRKASGMFWRGQSQVRELRLLGEMCQPNEIRLHAGTISTVTGEYVGAKSTDKALIEAIYY